MDTNEISIRVISYGAEYAIRVDGQILTYEDTTGLHVRTFGREVDAAHAAAQHLLALERAAG